MIYDRVALRVRGTYADRKIEFQREMTWHELQTPADIERFRRYFDDTLLAELLRVDLLYGVSLGKREARIGRGEFRDDGDWLDAALFPPDPIEVLAQDMNRVLADRAREKRRKSP